MHAEGTEALGLLAARVPRGSAGRTEEGSGAARQEEYRGGEVEGTGAGARLKKSGQKDACKAKGAPRLADRGARGRPFRAPGRGRSGREAVAPRPRPEGTPRGSARPAVAARRGRPRPFRN
ncbi:unnamed protein product [Prorocentrum cordatum]|uniref:Uncharacterized protein n=1 Tax=Prorocentrum cordatum TaxID=2364126 RepID=A0ABN9YBV6_9DINO|nr:unnamed protein product [Polarella glacialis]